MGATMQMPFLLLLLVVLITSCNGWRSVTVIPENEDESCPVGNSIPCNEVINVNNTVLRYERENMTYESSSIPSESCPWKIKGPPGTRILLRTTCFHHFHIRNLTEYAVCFHVNPVHDEFLTSSKICSGGYVSYMLIPTNEADLSVYYDKGHKYELGFTMEISFIGDPLPEPETTISPTTPNSDSTTSHASPSARVKGVPLLLSVLTAAVLSMRL